MGSPGFRPPDARGLNAMDMWEQEQEKRLNPYGPARPPWPSEPPTGRHRMRALWSRLRALLGRNRGDGAQGS
jgi:hypothetical protein